MSVFLAALSALSNPADAFVVTGISAGVNNATGERPFRRDINELYMSGPAWDLFILSLREFQQADQDDPLSYYQVAGIHGLPRAPWDGVVGQEASPGYCVHGAVTFPTWHRPYVALFEQILWTHAQSIAQDYPLGQRDSYVTAAQSLRMPYWDAFNSPTLPLAASLPTITVNGPNGTRTFDNPLYKYTFHADEGGNRFPADNWLSQFPWTVRHWDSANQQSNIIEVNAELEHQYDAVLPLIYKLFASETDYTKMSCTTSSGNSIENVHNLVHNAVGGNGHMTDTVIAAFDPIFWLHHTNVDRLFAMWQAINPQSYVVPTTNTVGNYAVPKGFVDTADSSLLPFHSDNGTRFWSSNDVRSIRTFGYAYQDVMDWNTNQSTLAGDVRANVNRLYAPAVSTRQPRRFSSGSNTEPPGAHPESSHMTSTLRSNKTERQWSITVQVRRFAHQSPFLIDFFVGSPPSSPSAWSTAGNLVGSHAHFIASNLDLTHLDGSQSALNHGEVSLTHCLLANVQRGALADLEPDSVIPFLTKSLNWRARDMDGCELDLDSLAALSIAVGSQIVRPAKIPNGFPTYDEMEMYANVTAGKPGGWEWRAA
ncbi:hypothetical protein EPUS_02199 [Endocarpon pusillum Z07020]|uniref:tyrosinase n=1 Tax=Endocarpon pusillum (strain Z07020 / HMAS-L-300199) TaxID=1263415 RepID=U1G4R5_ENDPU|nr:uncharacterized protein EPUS_02199 [Endocarpon pusillum Z07020]ERF72312.1 hypothetical protein EPUS_02199 [Endocarpon pusillum Z07020]